MIHAYNNSIIITISIDIYDYLGKRVRTNDVGYEELEEWKAIASTLKIQCMSCMHLVDVASRLSSHA